MITISCIECGGPKQVNVGRGRPSYFCSAKCRIKAHRKSKLPSHVDEYAAKRLAIDQQYIRARRTSTTKPALRRRAMIYLSNGSWSTADIAALFGVTEQRIRTIIGEEAKNNVRRN